jgi:hypothetical protein
LWAEGRIPATITGNQNRTIAPAITASHTMVGSLHVLVPRHIRAAYIPGLAAAVWHLLMTFHGDRLSRKKRVISRIGMQTLFQHVSIETQLPSSAAGRTS